MTGRLSPLALRLKEAIDCGDAMDCQAFVGLLLETLSPKTNGVSRAIGAVADALPSDAEQDAIVEEVFARATKPTQSPLGVQETPRRNCRPIPQPGDRVGPDDVRVGEADRVKTLLTQAIALSKTAKNKSTIRPGDSVRPDDVEPEDVIRVRSGAWVLQVKLSFEIAYGIWEGEVVAVEELPDSATHRNPAEWFGIGAKKTVSNWSSITLVSRAEPAPQPSPLQLQVGHRYRARDGSEWECVHENQSEEIDGSRFLCRDVGADLVSNTFCEDGQFIRGRRCEADLIEDLGPTPSAKPVDIDAVLNPFRALENELRAHSSDETLTTEVAATYEIAANRLRSALKTARKVFP